MNRLYRTTIVETSGIRTIAGGGTNATTASAALINLGALPSTIYQNASGNWQDTYTIVQTNSASWEESADIIPAVTNYLSSNNVLLSSATISNTLSISNLSVFGQILSGNTDLVTIINNLMPKYVSVSATNVSEGNYSLSGFSTNKFLIKWVNIETTSTDYDLSIFAKQDYTTDRFDVAFNQNGNNSFYLDYPFEDLDSNNNLYINFTSNSGSENYTVEVKAVTLQ
jgi:hypothetical protein